MVMEQADKAGTILPWRFLLPIPILFLWAGSIAGNQMMAVPAGILFHTGLEDAEWPTYMPMYMPWNLIRTTVQLCIQEMMAVFFVQLIPEIAGPIEVTDYRYTSFTGFPIRIQMPAW